ncbi:MAG: UDP-N-acetylmuramoyl-L-alanine--D-glutamate ligase [Magnetospirillum sp.]|nr:UDP-N-acetylmuramoyl-L-alanine--D-glutamate ligase [Magnetospirillum sp.]
MIPTPFLAGKIVAVMGLGKSGTATAAALRASGATVWAWDDNAAARETAIAAGVPIVDLHAADMAALALLVWSPGIAHTHPRPHPIADKARAAGIPLVCDVDLLARAKPDARFLAVTGTNGKSTTTTLLAHVLAGAGRGVAAGGNLGTAALAMPDLGAEGRYVLELSSYQLELVPSLRLAAGVLLNITPDHLGRHGGMDGYIAAKRILFDRLAKDGTAVIGVDDEPCAAMADELECRGLRVVRLSAARRLGSGVSAPDGVLLDNGIPVCNLKSIARLPGRHNWQNACAAYAMARADGASPEAIAAALSTYPGLAHRQELVAVIDGVAYVNDSKATNADAAEKALVCYDRIYWIIGGQMKEGGIASLAPLFPRIAHAFLIGEAGKPFAAALGRQVPHTTCGTLDVAVAKAHAMATADRAEGAVVLLSPACASWDQFKSFEHRGETFRQLVAALPGERRAA